MTIDVQSPIEANDDYYTTSQGQSLTVNAAAAAPMVIVSCTPNDQAACTAIYPFQYCPNFNWNYEIFDDVTLAEAQLC